MPCDGELARALSDGGAGVANSPHEPSPATQSVDEPVHAAPLLTGSDVLVYSSWPTAVHVERAAVLSTQAFGMVPSPATHSVDAVSYTHLTLPTKA